MSGLRLRNRQRLRRKEIAALLARLERDFGGAPFTEEDPLETADTEDTRLILLGGHAMAVIVGEGVAPTVRGLLARRPSRRHVTVDMGAVRFVYNGADVMAPGIVDADADIAPGDLVWIRDEKNGRPLAIGEALMSGGEMVSSRAGKAVRSLHHVGDEVWTLGEPPPQAQ